MLYNIEITKETAKDIERLTNKLYIFLGRYVPARLKYENEEDHNDCIQDTIMFILGRYNQIAHEIDVNNFNYEKYFYNRARSYISYWIRRHSKERKAKRAYIENAIYLQQHSNEVNFKPVDHQVLEKIVKEYNFDTKDNILLLSISQGYLEGIGYDSEDKYQTDKEVNPHKQELMEKLAYAVIDEYLVEVMGG